MINAKKKRTTQGRFCDKSRISCQTLVFCSGGGAMRSRVLKNVMVKSIQAAIPHTTMVNCQPNFSSPLPSHLTSEGVAAVTNVAPPNAKIKRKPLMVERSCGSFDITPDKAL